LGVDGVAFSSRHTFATLLCPRSLARPVNPEILRRILGDTSHALLPRYVHLATADLLRG
jgi:hypothetical protein